MKHIWRTGCVGLLALNLFGVVLAVTIGGMLPYSDAVSFLVGQSNNRTLYVMDVNHQLAAQLARGTNPFPSYAWSPDGTQLAYVIETDYNDDIFKVEVTCASLFAVCGTPSKLTQHSAQDIEPAWSPNGTSIAFVTSRNGAPEIYWMPTSGAAAYNLTHDPATDSFPIWSPDGRYLAFYSDRSGFLEVYVMHMDCLEHIGSCASAVHRLGGGFNSLPAWSPDSKRLAYFANGDLLVAETACLAQSDDCASKAQNLTRSSYTDWYPVWSPDSRRLLFQSNRGSQPQIYAADMDCESTITDCAVLLKNALSYNLYPSFSADGRQIMVISNNPNSQELYLMRDDGSDVRQLTKMGGQISSPRWRPRLP